MTEFHRGDRVTYVPGHAKADINHPDAEGGTVSSVANDVVFVKFDATVKKLGWKGTTAMACTPTDLVNHGGSKD